MERTPGWGRVISVREFVLPEEFVPCSELVLPEGFVPDSELVLPGELFPVCVCAGLLTVTDSCAESSVLELSILELSILEFSILCIWVASGSMGVKVSVSPQPLKSSSPQQSNDIYFMRNELFLCMVNLEKCHFLYSLPRREIKGNM